MTRRSVATGLLGAVLIAALAVESFAVGLGFGPLVTTVDVAGAFAKVPVAAEGAFDALDDALADLGVPSADRAEIRAGLEESLDDVEEALAQAPTVLPLPLLGGFVEIPLPLVVVDGVRLSGGYLSDELARSAAALVGLSIPSPLVDLSFDEDGFSGSIVADMGFRSWLLATELVKRLDLFLVALDLSVGVHVVGGKAEPSVEIDVPAEIEDGVAEAVEALHLDGFAWSSFALHAGVGVEIGPPFLRLGLSVRFVLPISVSSGWWDLTAGGLGGALSVVIRF
jgi:hypothetical protein